MFKKLFQLFASVLVFFIMLFIFDFSLIMAIFSSELSVIDIWKLICSLANYGYSNHEIQAMTQMLLSMNKKYSNMFLKNFKEIINNDLYDYNEKTFLISYELSLEHNRSQISHILNIFNIEKTAIFNKNYLETLSLTQEINENFYKFSEEVIKEYQEALKPGISNILQNSNQRIIDETLKLISENNNYNPMKKYLRKEKINEKTISQIIDFCQKKSYVNLDTCNKIESIVYQESLKLDPESSHIKDPKNMINNFIKTMRENKEIDTKKEFNDFKKYIKNTNKNNEMERAFLNMNTTTTDQHSGYTVADIIGFTWFCLKEIDTDTSNKNIFIDEVEKILNSKRDIIQPDDSVKKDQPLCFVGQYKGVISFLSGIHPGFYVEAISHEMLTKNIHDFFDEIISNNNKYQQLIIDSIKYKDENAIPKMLEDMSNNNIFGKNGKLYKKLKEVTKLDTQIQNYYDKDYYEYYEWEKLLNEIQKSPSHILYETNITL